MKRLISVCSVLTFLMFASFNFFAQSVDDVINFSMSTKELYEAVNGGREADIDPAKMYLLDGLVSEIQVVNRDKADFYAESILVTGEWEGFSTVKTYRCIVLFEGGHFFDRIPARPPREPQPYQVLANTEVIVIAQYLGSIEMEDGELLPVLTASHVRVLL